MNRLKQLSDPAQSAENVAAGRQQWYAGAAQYLQRPDVDHWFCQHGAVARGLAEVLRSDLTCMASVLRYLNCALCAIDMDIVAETKLSIAGLRTNWWCSAYGPPSHSSSRHAATASTRTMLPRWPCRHRVTDEQILASITRPPLHICCMRPDCHGSQTALTVLQLFVREEFSEESSAPLLAVMQRHDIERLGAQLNRTTGSTH